MAAAAAATDGPFALADTLPLEPGRLLMHLHGVVLHFFYIEPI